MMSVLRDIVCLLKPFKRQIIFLNLLYLVSACFDLLGLAFLGYYVSILMGSNSLGILHQIARVIHLDANVDRASVFLVVLFVVKTLMGSLTIFITNRTVSAIESRIKDEMLNGYQHLPYLIWSRKNSSEYVSTLTLLIPKVFVSVILPTFKLASDSVLALAIFMFFSALNPRAIFIFGVIVAIFSFVYDLAVKRKLGVFSNQFKSLSAGILSETRNTMDGTKEIRILGAQDFFTDRFSRLASSYSRSQSLLNTFSQLPRYLLELIIVSFVAVLVLIEHQSGENTAELLPLFGVFAAGAIRLSPMLSLTMSLATNLRFYRDTISKLVEDYESCRVLGCAKTVASNGVGTASVNRISVEDLHFRYCHQGPWTVRGLNLKLSKGDSIAIVGESGVGKTTFLDLMLGLLTPQEGTIEVYDSSQNIIPSGLAGQVSYIPQQPLLIDDTLRRNVAFGVPDKLIDDDRVMSALRKANLSDLFDGLGLGLDTPLGDKGNRLSGGQKQRVVLARTFYFDKPVICLDEATSALDSKNESTIIREFLSNCSNKIVIAITHNPELAAYFGKQVRLEPQT